MTAITAAAVTAEMFEARLREYGISRMARELGLSRQAVHQWAMGRPLPEVRRRWVEDSLGFAAGSLRAVVSDDSRQGTGAAAVKEPDGRDAETFLGWLLFQRTMSGRLGLRFEDRVAKAAEVAGVAPGVVKAWVRGAAMIPADVLEPLVAFAWPGLTAASFVYAGEVCEPVTSAGEAAAVARGLAAAQAAGSFHAARVALLEAEQAWVTARYQVPVVFEGKLEGLEADLEPWLTRYRVRSAGRWAV